MVFKDLNVQAGKSLVLTKKEIEVIDKRLRGKKLSQQDSNYLSRFVRPKLKEISEIDARLLLDKLGYNQKARSIEKKIKKIILESIKEVEAIVLYGSAIQNNYKDYNDIDVLVVVKEKFWRKLYEKIDKIVEIKKIAKKSGIVLDLEIYDKKTFFEVVPYSLSLAYQLKDKKAIYGNLKTPKRLELYKISLEMKLDYSCLEDKDSSGEEIYKAIRNLVLVKMALKKVVDNYKLKNCLIEEFGESLIERLKNNQASKEEKRFALRQLTSQVDSVIKKLREEKWEKMMLSGH